MEKERVKAHSGRQTKQVEPFLKAGLKGDCPENIKILEVLDEVRRQGGLEYPKCIESTEYSLEF